MKTLSMLVLATLLLCGCAHHYLITLNNGSQVTASTKPKLKQGYYFFKDAQGRDSYVAVGRVREIEAGGKVKDSSLTFHPPK